MSSSPGLSTVASLQRLAARMGVTPEVAGRVYELTVRALGEQLSRQECSTLSAALPPTVGVWLDGSATREGRGLAVLLARVLELDPSVGPGHVTAVCQVMTEALSAETVTALRSALAIDVAALFR